MFVEKRELPQSKRLPDRQLRYTVFPGLHLQLFSQCYRGLHNTVLRLVRLSLDLLLEIVVPSVVETACGQPVVLQHDARSFRASLASLLDPSNTPFSSLFPQIQQCTSFLLLSKSQEEFFLLSSRKTLMC